MKMSTRKRRMCYVPQCEVKESITENISFHKFPKNERQKKQWLKILKMKSESITKHTLVCSKHFLKQDYFINANGFRRDLKKNVVPSLYLPVTLITQKIKNQNTMKEREMRVMKRNNSKRFLNLHKLQRLHRDDEDIVDVEMHTELKVNDNIEKSMEIQVQKCSMCQGTRIITRNMKTIEKVMFDKEVQTEKETCDKSLQVQESFIFSDFLDTDTKLNTVSGVTSFDNFAYLKSSIEKVKKTNQMGKATSKLNLKDQIILTLAKLKLNLSFACLAILFRVSRQTCRNEFYTMLGLLSACLSPLIRWPPKDEILENMPKCFKFFPSTRVIFDGTEIPIQKRKCLKCRIATYSQYKSGHTVKFIVGITPSGLISFVSDSYAGRASDKQIIVESGILDKLIPDEDSVMCDKGVLIQNECKKRKIKLIMPCSKSKIVVQFSPQEANLNQKIASARVHVERSIQRLKIFKILKGPLSWDVVSWSPEIMRVICGLVNLSPPILKEDKF
ncbi:uncharacterized protein LOC127287590 [Leptopilina boulardi]|uniref:uncharacterized protein LOC127287590 n=1 Tax=Leptopilina boulardi TaxID=63433 RepID=UPI0021F5E5B6|nr:uncharacterized protein LOC127287590 [Leptopilina boulardi]